MNIPQSSKRGSSIMSLRSTIEMDKEKRLEQLIKSYRVNESTKKQIMYQAQSRGLKVAATSLGHRDPSKERLNLPQLG